MLKAFQGLTSPRPHLHSAVGFKAVPWVGDASLAVTLGDF